MKKYTFAAIMLIAAGLRLYQLGQAQFWYDEAFTAWVSRLPLLDMIRATAGDTHPPLYLLLTWLINANYRVSEYAYRLPSVVFSLLALWLTWRLAQDLKLPDSVQIAGLAAMAIMPNQLYFAQEARMYALLQAEVMLMLVAVIERRWWVLGLTALACLYTHNYALFYLPVIGAIGLVGELKRPLHVSAEEYHGLQYQPSDQANPWALVLALGIPIVLWLPWLAVLAGQMKTVSTGYWIQPVTPGAAIYATYMQFWGFGMLENWQPVAVLLGLGMLAFGLWKGIQARLWILIWVGFAPLFLTVLASLIWQPVLLFRGLIGSDPALYFLVAAALFDDRQPMLNQAYALALIVPVLLAGIYGYYANNPANKGGSLEIIDQVRALWQPGDVIVHVNDGSAVPWGVYAADLPQVEMIECSQHDLGALSPATRSAMGIRQADLDQVSHRRAWIIWSEGPTSTTCETDQAARLIAGGKEVIQIRDDEMIHAGVWLK
jgi:mannosyltransferase